MTYVMELHGGINDGLRLPNKSLHPMIVAPSTWAVPTVEAYVEWEPQTGEVVDLYVIRGAPTTNTEGLPYPVHHMHFHHQETVPEMRET